MVRVRSFTVAGLVLCMPVFGDEPTSVGLEDMAATLRGNVRLIAMGDSYSAPYFTRVPAAALRTWPIPTISAIGGGAPVSSQLFRCYARCNPVSLIQSVDDFGYAVERNTSKSFFALPLRGLREMYTDESFDDEGTDLLFEFTFDTAGRNYMSSGVHGSFAGEGDDIRFRFLYRCPSELSLQLEEIAFTDGSSDSGVAQLQSGARPFWHLGENPEKGTRPAIPSQINATAVDFPANNNIYTTLTVGLKQTSPLNGTNKYFEPAGCLYYKQTSNGVPKSGMYYSHISDDSWSYLGFGCDTSSTGTHDKKFSLDQFTHWLDVTTLDRNQPTVFMWYLAPEALGYNASLGSMENMIDQAEEAAIRVGLTDTQHFLVISHLFSMNGSTQEEARQFVLNQQNAAFDLAASRSNVSAASIFEATDQVLFVNSSAMPWLTDHGFTTFEFGSNTINLAATSGGDLLDNSNVHPKNENSAAFFSAVLGDIIRKAGCPADLTGDGIINVGDLLLVIKGWNTGGEGDINGDGTINIIDILQIVEQWGECWPVQAPFSTGQFE